MDTKRETRHVNHQMRRGNTRDTSRDMTLKPKWNKARDTTRKSPDGARKHTRHEPRNETKTKIDTKREARHANHQMRRGNKRDTSRAMRLKLKLIQSARHDTRITR